MAAAPDLGLRFDAAIARALDVDPAARPSPVELAAQLTTRLETWGVARPNPGAVAAPYPRQGAPSGVDMQAPTRVARERPSAAPPENAALQRPAPQQLALQQLAPQQLAPSPSGRAGYGGRAIFVAMLAVLAVLVLPRLLGGDRGLPGASAEASAEASATASATALSSDGETMLVALSRVDSAIEAARGGKDGLKGRDGNELAQLATSVRTTVDRGDLGAAATAAQALSDRGRALTTGLDRPRRDSLLAAIDGLLAALSPR